VFLLLVKDRSDEVKRGERPRKNVVANVRKKKKGGFNTLQNGREGSQVHCAVCHGHQGGGGRAAHSRASSEGKEPKIHREEKGKSSLTIEKKVCWRGGGCAREKSPRRTKGGANTQPHRRGD